MSVGGGLIVYQTLTHTITHQHIQPKHPHNILLACVLSLLFKNTCNFTKKLLNIFTFLKKFL